MLKQNDFRFFGLAFLHVAGLLFLNTLTGTEVSGQSVKTATKFSSVYTDSTKDCKGAEPTFTCKGYGGYKLVLDIGGVFQTARIDALKSDFSVQIAGLQSIGWNPKVEWRMANGKPFAVIVRVDVNDENADIPKKIGEKLIVMGLQGYESISDEIDAKTPQANEKAREIADKGFTKKDDAIQSDAAPTNRETTKESDFWGHFSIKGKAPKGFADIYILTLGGNGEYGAKANPPFYGFIRLENKAQTDYPLLKPTVNGKNFSFKTKVVAGISYDFDGAFSRLDFTEEGKRPEGDNYDEAILSGTLKKMKVGKMIAESKVDFTWELGD